MHLRSERFGIRGVSRKGLDRNRDALEVTQQSVNDLHLPCLSVARIAERGQRVADAFQVAAGDVVQIQVGLPSAVTEAEQAIFNLLLVLGQPVQIVVQIVFIKVLQFQDVASGVGVGQPYGGKSGTLFQDACEYLPQSSLAVLGRAQGMHQADALSNLPERRHGPARDSLLDGDVLVDVAELLKVVLVLESELDGPDLGLGAVRQVGESAVGNFPVLAEGLAEQVSGVLLAADGVSAGVDEHSVHIIALIIRQSNTKLKTYQKY